MAEEILTNKTISETKRARDNISKGKFYTEEEAGSILNG